MPIREKTDQVIKEKPREPYESLIGAAMALEVRTITQSWVFPYTHLIHSCLNPSHGLVITFVSHQVMVTGRNLQILHEALASLSLKRIEPTNPFVLQTGERDVHIEIIKVVPIADIESLSCLE